VQDFHVVELSREPIGELACAVRRIVVDHEHVDAVFAKGAQHRL